VASPGIVSFVDFTGTASTEEIEAVDRVFRSGQLILGNEVSLFESTWAERCGCNYAVGVGNGLDAIEIGLRSLGIGPGDEVITTPMTAVATVLGIVRAGGTPVLADIDPETALISLSSVDRCLTSRTKAVLLVHLYGQMRDLHEWKNYCETHGLALIEDCAQSHDAIDEGRVAGSWGEFGAFSFYPTKNLGAAGDAGALVTNGKDIAERARSLRNYGQRSRYEHEFVGLNSRMDEVQAAILRCRVEKLCEWTERRRQIASRYRNEIQSDYIRLLVEPRSLDNHVYHLFVVASRERERLQRHLIDLGVETLIHYPIPIHEQSPFRSLTTDPIGLMNSEDHARECLSLPCRPNMSDSEVERVVEAVNTFRP